MKRPAFRMHVTKERRRCVHSAMLQVAEPACLPHFVALLPVPSSSSSLSHSPLVLSLFLAVSHKVSPSANRTTNNHKVAALCRNRIPTLLGWPWMAAGIKSRRSFNRAEGYNALNPFRCRGTAGNVCNDVRAISNYLSSR